MLNIVILAAGQGSRMRSSLPKVLHTLAGKPLLEHVIHTAKKLTPSVLVIYGHGGETVPKTLSHLEVTWIKQTEQLGTGHAVLQALPKLDSAGRTLVLYGDTPLISEDLLKKLIDSTPNHSIGWLTATVENPSGLGRIVRDAHDKPLAIVEEKDASLDQKKIEEINTGICLIPNNFLKASLPNLTANNAQKEFYLTDLFSKAIENNIDLITVNIKDNIAIKGINNKLELALLERLYQEELAKKLALSGLTLLDYRRIDIRGNLTFGQDCTIDINVILEGEVFLGNHCHIGANCFLKNVTLGNNVIIEPNSIIEGAHVEENAHIGPFARLRPETLIKKGAKIGNFVEIKKSSIGAHSKVNHLSYIGDTLMGEEVNIGAGTITCNYDGANKHQTIIEDGVFVGSNTSLIAPIILGENATIGAGSTISKSAEKEKLTLARSKQTTISDWQRPKKKRLPPES